MSESQPELRPFLPTAVVNWSFAGFSLVLLLVAFWALAKHFEISQRLSGNFPSAFASFAFLMVPYWAFGFGAAQVLSKWLSWRTARVLAPGLLALSYGIFSLPRGQFQAKYAALFFTITVGLAALFEWAPRLRQPGTQNAFTWR